MIYKSPSHKNVRNISKSSQVKLVLVQTVDRFSEFRQDWNPVCSLDKNPSLVFVTFKQYLNWMVNDTRWLKPSERNRVCVLKHCLLSGVIWAREHGKFDSRYLWKSLWVTLIAIGFVLVFQQPLKEGCVLETVKLWHTKLDRENRFQTSRAQSKPKPKHKQTVVVFAFLSVPAFPGRLTATHSPFSNSRVLSQRLRWVIAVPETILQI